MLIYKYPKSKYLKLYLCNQQYFSQLLSMEFTGGTVSELNLMEPSDLCVFLPSQASVIKFKWYSTKAELLIKKSWNVTNTVLQSSVQYAI